MAKDEERLPRYIDTRGAARAIDADNEQIEEHDREPRRAKITVTEIHRDLIARVDNERALRILAALKAALPKTEWLVFLALHFGVVEDARGILRFHPACQEAKARTPTLDEVARHYRIARTTVERYDRSARARYAELDAELFPLSGLLLEERRAKEQAESS